MSVESRTGSNERRLGMAIVLAIFTLSLWTSVSATASSDPDYQGSRFSEVWDQIASDPYKTMPHYQVTFSSFFGFLRDKIYESAKRTISDRNDLLPTFTKLVHANGMCFAGTWNITEDSTYTGYFKKGSKAMIIVRASAATSDTTVGTYRAFGLAGKLYPTENSEHSEPLKTANFFTIEDLLGALTPRFTDAQLQNEPKQTKRLGILTSLNLAAATASAFRLADSHIGIRQVYEIAELGMSDTSQAKSPKWMMLQGASARPIDKSGEPAIEAADFRDELRLVNQNGKLVFNIFVSSPGATTTNRQYTKIGYIELTKEALSNSCDHRLHFHHPRWESKFE